MSQGFPQETPLAPGRCIDTALRRTGRGVNAALLLLACCWFHSGAADVARGEYVLRAAGCVACHTDVDNDGAHLAGGRPIETPFGTFYPPNITPDRDTGIGNWTRQQFRNALIQGVGPGGTDYYPVFPYTAYSGMTPEDIDALYDYLQKIPAVSQANRAHDLPWYLQLRLINRAWKWLYFEVRRPGPDRGEYLVKALGHCDECHTPRNWLGALNYDRHLSGNPNGPDGEPVPNITPDRDTGIGRWSRGELTRYLSIGMRPDRDFAGGLMVDVIDEGLSHLSDTDRESIADYLRSLPPRPSAVND